MADPNNIPQEAEQLKRQMADQDSTPKVADVNFDKEYQIAKANDNGDDSQSSDPNPVGRQGAEASDSRDGGAFQGNRTQTNTGSSPQAAGNPANYREMAEDVTPKDQG